MIRYATGEKDAIYSSNRRFRASLELACNGSEKVVIGNDNIISIKIRESCTSTTSFSLGGGVATYVEVNLRNLGSNIVDSDRKSEVWFYCSNGGTEYATNVISFYAQKPEIDNGIYTVKGYGVVSKMGSAYIDDGDRNVAEIVNNISAQTGIVIDTKYMNLMEMENIDFTPSGSCLDVARGIGQMYGAIVSESESGTITINDFRDDALHIDADRVYEDIIETSEPFHMGQCVYYENGEKVVFDGSSIVEYSDGNDTLYFDSEFVNDMSVVLVWSTYKDFIFTPCVVSFLGDYHIQCGDTIYIDKPDGSSIRVPVMEHELYYDGGLKSTVRSYGVGDNVEEEYIAPTESRVDGIERRVQVLENVKVNAGTSETVNIPANTVYKDVVFEFADAFAKPPTVTATLVASPTGAVYGSVILTIVSVTQIGFTARIVNGAKANINQKIAWIAFGEVAK